MIAYNLSPSQPMALYCSRKVGRDRVPTRTTCNGRLTRYSLPWSDLDIRISADRRNSPFMNCRAQTNLKSEVGGVMSEAQLTLVIEFLFTDEVPRDPYPAYRFRREVCLGKGS